jgi:hypothetical protein
LRSIRLYQPGIRAAYEADLEAVMFAVQRRARLDDAITEMAADSESTALPGRLCCLRGISTLTGFALAVELGEWDRFTGASIGAYVGLVPSELSSGDSRRQCESPSRATPTPADCSSRRPGTTSPSSSSAPSSKPGGIRPPQLHATGGTPAGAGPWPPWSSASHQIELTSEPVRAARGADPRFDCEPRARS